MGDAYSFDSPRSPQPRGVTSYILNFGDNTIQYLNAQGEFESVAIPPRKIPKVREQCDESIRFQNEFGFAVTVKKDETEDKYYIYEDSARALKKIIKKITNEVLTPSSGSSRSSRSSSRGSDSDDLFFGVGAAANSGNNSAAANSGNNNGVAANAGNNNGGSRRRRRPSRNYKKSKRVLRRKSRSTRRR
jgi:hypothetical protein